MLSDYYERKELLSRYALLKFKKSKTAKVHANGEVLFFYLVLYKF